MTPDDYLTLALGGITQMEAASQQSLMHLGRLPIEGSLNKRAKFEALGFVFGKVIDELFISVTFPNGWRLEPNGSFHSTLLDEQGRVRGMVSYKAAPYDRWARVTLDEYTAQV